MYVVGAGVILYSVPYCCLVAVFKERNKRGCSPRGSSMSLRKME
jgi:hypothetical protein